MRNRSTSCDRSGYALRITHYALRIRIPVRTTPAPPECPIPACPRATRPVAWRIHPSTGWEPAFVFVGDPGMTSSGDVSSNPGRLLQANPDHRGPLSDAPSRVAAPSSSPPQPSLAPPPAGTLPPVFPSHDPDVLA